MLTSSRIKSKGDISALLWPSLPLKATGTAQPRAVAISVSTRKSDNESSINERRTLAVESMA